jgi:hypothetical protein
MQRLAVTQLPAIVRGLWLCRVCGETAYIKLFQIYVYVLSYGRWERCGGHGNLYIGVARDHPRTVRNIVTVSAPLAIQLSSDHPVTPKKEVRNAKTNRHQHNVAGRLLRGAG